MLNSYVLSHLQKFLKFLSTNLTDVIVRLVTLEDIVKKDFLHVTRCLVKTKECVSTSMKRIIAVNVSIRIPEKIAKVGPSTISMSR